jgi:hypothetical protein
MWLTYSIWVSLFLNTIAEHIDGFVPSWQDFTKSVAAEIQLLHSQPLTNSRFHFLITAQCTKRSKLHQCSWQVYWKVLIMQSNKWAVFEAVMTCLFNLYDLNSVYQDIGGVTSSLFHGNHIRNLRQLQIQAEDSSYKWRYFGWYQL